MPGERLPMRKVRDVLRLSAGGMSKRKIAASLCISPTAAGECLRRARRAGLGWPLPAEMSDETLESRLYPAPANAKDNRPLPDWPRVHRELRRPGVTLQLLWEEHRSAQPEGYGYSRFCELYQSWKGRLSPTMRQTHVAGERLFVDYAGTTLEVIDGTSGEVITAQLFVAALGASNYTYAEATWTQGLADWIGSHTRAFAFFGGVPAMVVSDNLKSGVTKACFYEPTVNRSYAEMAAHYDTAVVPARPYKPRDKTIASYCTSFWGWDDSGVVGVATAMAFDDHDSRRYLPQSTVEAVGVVLLDEPLAAPLMDGGSCDGEPCRDLTCREHATAAQALMSACQLIGGADEGDLFGVEEQSLRAAPSVAIEDVSDLTVAVLIEHSIDGGDEFGFELADLGDGQRPLEHQRARSAAR